MDPARLVRAHLSRRGSWVSVHDPHREYARWRGPSLVIGAGKAAARMAAGCEAGLGPGHVSGLVIVPDGYRVPLAAIAAAEAGHPVPDRRGEEATARLCRLLARAEPGTVLCLLSGGASSVLVRPRVPVTLDDKIVLNRLLLASGADIEEINTVRKHVSAVKGGGLLRVAGSRRLVTLIVSDVIGDDPGVVGSGPTAPDRSTFKDAQVVLHRRGIASRVPESVRAVISRGVRGAVPETVKPGSPEAARAVNLVIGSNRMALAAAADEAARLGYRAVCTGSALAGDTARAARRWIESVKQQTRGRPGEPCCVLAGGETTVQVKGAGRGGRNQEFALAIADSLSDTPIAVLSAGSDGIDGPTDAAGAFVDGQTRSRARQLGLDPAAALDANDSYAFFDRLGDLFRCGPTGTNVMDLKIALRPAS